MSNPGFYFYPGDWYKDTRVLSLQCRGAWIDLLGELNERGGLVSWTMPEYARFWGCAEDVAAEIVRDLSRHNTAHVTEDSHGLVTIESRRLKRELKARFDARLRKQAERDRKQVSRDGHKGTSRSVTPPLLNPSPSPSPSPSLNSKNKEALIEIPDWIPVEPWERYLKHRKHKRAKVTSDAAEGLIEQLAEFKRQGEDLSAVLKQSVTNGWTKLVAISGNGKGKLQELATSQVPAYKPLPQEPKPTTEEQERVKKMVQDLTVKMESV